MVFCNKDEALSFANTDNLDVAIETLKTLCKEFVITLGAEGAMIFNQDTLTNIAGVNVNAVDTNGAGDMFAGAYLYGITNGMSREAAGNFASTAAAKVVSQFGPRLLPEQHQMLLQETT